MKHPNAYQPLHDATLANLMAAKDAIERIKFRHIKWQQWQEAEMEKLLELDRAGNNGTNTEAMQRQHAETRATIRERREELEAVFALLETTKHLYEYLEVMGYRHFDQGFEKGTEYGYHLARVQHNPQNQSEYFWQTRARSLREFNPEIDMLSALIAATPLKTL